jgi:hypothetical protein
MGPLSTPTSTSNPQACRSLTKTINGIWKPFKLRSLWGEEPNLAWRVAFETNYTGDLRILPFHAIPDVDEGLMLVTSREIYHHLCSERRLAHLRTISEVRLYNHNRYNNEQSDRREDEELRKMLLNIPMRHGWYDLVEDLSSRYPIACAKIALFCRHARYFKYLVENYGVDPKKLERTETPLILSTGEHLEVYLLRRQSVVPVIWR